MRKVYLAQINTSFGDNAFLPYSAGLLWAKAMADASLRDAYSLGGFLCHRSPMVDTVSSISSPDVLALSCYVWNWRYSMALAESVRCLYPGCLIVIGGPEVPNRSDGFLESNPSIDVLVHGEGEDAFSEILLARIAGQPLDGVSGISIRDSSGRTIRTAPRRRSAEIDAIPSPYISGVFDGLLDDHPSTNWHASQETHRGCPYSCTFCDWGSAVYTKIREFSTDRLVDEMRWFGDNRIDLLYNCDANYGILKRDIDLTRSLVATKARTGYPRKFRASYAKKSDGKVFEISRMLSDAGMSKGVTLSLQSLDEATLEIVRRSNISMDNFGELVRMYAEHGMPTYTEIILGLPGESRRSFVDGMERVLAAGQHDSVNVYPCMVLKNSEMGDPAYIQRHGIRMVTVPIGGNHCVPNDSGIDEYQDIVIGTATMDTGEWRESYRMSWIIQALHCLGPTQLLAMHYRLTHGTHVGFYAMLLDMFAGTDTVLGMEIRNLEGVLDGVVSGIHGFDRQLAGFGETMWPPEELAFLSISSQLDAFYSELRPVLHGIWDADVCDDLLSFQMNIVLDPHRTCDGIVRASHDVLTFYTDARAGINTQLARREGITRFASDRYFCGDKESYAREVVWYGRKQGLHLMRAERIG